MSEETPDDPIVSLRNEFAEQFAELKASFEASNKEKDEIIQQLKEQNQGLQRALVRSATTDPPIEKKEPTEEEVYAERVKSLAERTRQYMKEMQ